MAQRGSISICRIKIWSSLLKTSHAFLKLSCKTFFCLTLSRLWPGNVYRPSVTMAAPIRAPKREYIPLQQPNFYKNRIHSITRKGKTESLPDCTKELIPESLPKTEGKELDRLMFAPTKENKLVYTT